MADIEFTPEAVGRRIAHLEIERDKLLALLVAGARILRAHERAEWTVRAQDYLKARGLA